MINFIYVTLKKYLIFIFGLSAGVLFIVFPMVLDLLYIKNNILIMMAMYGLLLSFSSKYFINKDLFIISLFMITCGMFFTFYGLLAASPGWSKQGQLYIFWPLVFTFLMPLFSKKDIWRFINIIFLISTILIFIFSLYLIFLELNIISDLGLNTLLPNLKTGITLNEEGIELGWPGFNSLPFLIPFIFCFYVLRNSFSSSFKVNSSLVNIAVLCLLITVFLSGRRALILILLITPLLLIFLCYFLPASRSKKIIKNLFILFLIPMPLVLALLIYYQVDLLLIVNSFIEGFQFSDDTNISANRKQIQLYALLEGWSEVPLLGGGLGSHVTYIRSWDMPWSYEIYFLALLYQVGFLGFTIYLIGILWIFLESIKIIRLNNDYSLQIICLLCGMLGSLIASFTNPYLVRFDGLWVIFIPAAFINYYLTSVKSN
jgi:hypothetical protein